MDATSIGIPSASRRAAIASTRLTRLARAAARKSARVLSSGSRK
jgi:hypothetical protein